jgi:hypothetical protein
MESDIKCRTHLTVDLAGNIEDDNVFYQGHKGCHARTRVHLYPAKISRRPGQRNAISHRPILSSGRGDFLWWHSTRNQGWWGIPSCAESVKFIDSRTRQWCRHTCINRLWHARASRPPLLRLERPIGSLGSQHFPVRQQTYNNLLEWQRYRWRSPSLQKLEMNRVEKGVLRWEKRTPSIILHI